jgi:hypothetical protein
MSVASILFLSCATVAAFLFLMIRIMPWRYIVRFAVPIDIGFSVLAFFGFGGTLTGLCVAICSGLILAIVLTVAKRVSGAPDAIKNASVKFPFQIVRK